MVSMEPVRGPLVSNNCWTSATPFGRSCPPCSSTVSRDSPPRRCAQEFKRRYDRNVPDLYGMVLQPTDSLLLSRDQVEALQKVRASYRVRMDSAWTSLATYLAALPDRYDAHDAYKRAEDTIDAAWELTRRDVQRTRTTILNPVQLQLVPPVVRTLVTSQQPVHIRVVIQGG
jgi:hypothetical protein